MKAVLAAVLLAASALAVAQGRDRELVPLEAFEGNVLGAAFGFYPEYFGSPHERFGVAPVARYKLDGHRYVTWLATDVSVNLLDDPRWRLGLTGAYRFGRKAQQIEDPVVQRMRDINNSVDLGAYGGYEWSDANDIRKRFWVFGWAMHDVSGVHDGSVYGASFGGALPLTRPLTIAAGAGITYGSQEYMRTYFGVDGQDAAASGLAPYSPGAGTRDRRAWVSLILHLSPQWHVGAGAMYSRLGSEAARSPIVSVRGTSDQLVYGAGALRAW